MNPQDRSSLANDIAKLANDLAIVRQQREELLVQRNGLLDALKLAEVTIGRLNRGDIDMSLDVIRTVIAKTTNP